MVVGMGRSLTAAAPNKDAPVVLVLVFAAGAADPKSEVEVVVLFDGGAAEPNAAGPPPPKAPKPVVCPKAGCCWGCPNNPPVLKVGKGDMAADWRGGGGTEGIAGLILRGPREGMEVM